MFSFISASLPSLWLCLNPLSENPLTRLGGLFAVNASLRKLNQ
jgi:hypothetical protein